MRALIKRGAHANAHDEAGDTALHVAAQRGHKAALSALLTDPTAEPGRQNVAGASPLIVAASHGRWDCVRLLPEAGGEPQQPTGGAEADAHAGALHAAADVLAVCAVLWPPCSVRFVAVGRLDGCEVLAAHVPGGAIARHAASVVTLVSTVFPSVHVPPLGGVNTQSSTLSGHSVAPSAGVAQAMDWSLAVQVRGWHVPATWQMDGSGHTTLRHGSSGSGSTSHESPVQPASQRQTGPTEDVQPSTMSGPAST